MADDPVLREIAQMRADLRDDLQAIRAELGRLVPREVYDLRTAALEARIKAAEDAAAKADEQRRSDRRWVLGAVIVPVVVAVMQILLSLRGGA